MCIEFKNEGKEHTLVHTNVMGFISELGVSHSLKFRPIRKTRIKYPDFSAKQKYSTV